MASGAHSPVRCQVSEQEVGLNKQTQQPQASRASWPDKPDQAPQITRMARDLQLRDPPEDRFRDIQSINQSIYFNLHHSIQCYIYIHYNILNIIRHKLGLYQR